MGVLPFFHSFGFTVTLWFPLLTGLGVVYHPNPLDAKAIGELVAKHKATILLATPTFCKSYVRVCTREQFATLRYVIVGAEKLPDAIAQAFERSSASPCSKATAAPRWPRWSRSTSEDAAGRRHAADRHKARHRGPSASRRQRQSSIRRRASCCPYNQRGTAAGEGARTACRATSASRRRPRRSCEDGWYVTGDIACIDEDGFIRITDRLARFSKIGGEMVPHMRIEEAAAGIPRRLWLRRHRRPR